MPSDIVPANKYFDLRFEIEAVLQQLIFDVHA
jgi:hypothetical protein